MKLIKQFKEKLLVVVLHIWQLQMMRNEKQLRFTIYSNDEDEIMRENNMMSSLVKTNSIKLVRRVRLVRRTYLQNVKTNVKGISFKMTDICCEFYLHIVYFWLFLLNCFKVV